MNRSWAPDYLIRWYFDQDEFWVTAEGDKVLIDKMGSGHVLNTLLFLERVSNDIETDGYIQDTVLYRALYRRLLIELGAEDAEGDVPLNLASVPTDKADFNKFMDDILNPLFHQSRVYSTTDKRKVIQDAIDTGKDIRIDYKDAQGAATYSRKVTPVALRNRRTNAKPFEETVLLARHEDVLKTFYLSRIQAVTAVQDPS
jgi:hypothetical protein